MANERIHEMPTTNGTYQVQGIVSGVEKQDFYTEKKTKTGKNFRMVKFDVAYDTHKGIRMLLNGMPKDKVYYSRKDKNGKNVTSNVSWGDRMNIPSDARMFNSVNCGITKIVDANGKETNDNDKRILIDYDACEYIARNLKDGASVYVRGNIEFSSYSDNDGNINRSTKLIPSQVSLCQKVDFNNEDRTLVNDFTQTIVFMGIDQEKENDKPTGRFVVEAKIVNYNSIESVEFIIEDANIAKKFRTYLKPYYACTVFGKINMVHNIEEVNNDGWGPVNPMNKVKSSSKREFVIIGTEGGIDKDTYTEEAINNAIRKMNAATVAEENFSGKVKSSSNDDWGDTDSMDEEPW